MNKLNLIKLQNFPLSHLLIVVVAILFLSSTEPILAQQRSEINIPDIPGYVTLKCDFHMHTLFSDGIVWPTTRVEEAWREGLDVIAITEHIESKPSQGEIAKNLNRSYELALPTARKFNIILIKGGEITRQMPPGHFNAIFLKDIELLDTKNFTDAFQQAMTQEAFLFWNHPGDMWYSLHTEFYEKGWMHGI